LVAAGADRRRGFDLDQLLQRPTYELADQIDAIAGLQRGQQIRQGRLDEISRNAARAGTAAADVGVAAGAVAG